jgi:hypothetical protein
MNIETITSFLSIVLVVVTCGFIFSKLIGAFTEFALRVLKSQDDKRDDKW